MHDFIVLGAGSAGLAAVHSLALKYPRATILLVEQGGRAHPPASFRVPLLKHTIPYWPHGHRYLRRYTAALTPPTTTPPACASPPSSRTALQEWERWRAALVRGQGFGGSAMVDDMRCLRGSNRDYDAWGSSLWTGGIAASCFRRLERNSRGSGEGVVHGVDGPVVVSDPAGAQIHSELNVKFCDACEAAGVAPCADFNSGEPEGFGVFQSFVDGGVRGDVFDQLVERHKHRTPNVSVITGHYVDSLTFHTGTETAAPRCSGVSATSDGGQQVHFPCGVAVVSALGPLESPALLLRSGIGDRERIRKGQALVAELPAVGRGLIVPMKVNVAFRVADRGPTHGLRGAGLATWRYAVNQWKEFIEGQTGVFSSLGEVGAFVRSNEAECPQPDLLLELHGLPLEGGAKPSRHWWLPPFRQWYTGFTVSVTHLDPMGRGCVSLAANEARHPQRHQGGVALELDCWNHERDLKALEEGVLWSTLLCSDASTLQSPTYTSSDGSARAPFSAWEPSVTFPQRSLDSSEAIQEHIIRSAYVGDTVFGGCAMHCVVDERLNVKGVKGVMVADASVVPHPMRASERSVALLVGSRTAEFI